MADFRLSATLKGHEADARAVTFPTSKSLYSASRDCTVRQWTRTTNQAPFMFESSVIVRSPQHINSLTALPPSKDHPEGLIVSGGKDAIIDVREPGQDPNHNGRLLIGHANNVCALAPTHDGKGLISGGWDYQARRWDVQKAETTIEYKGHEHNVWAVLAYDQNTVITASADKHIRIFHASGKLLAKSRALPDVPRALCRLSSNHPSRASFASAGNDACLRFWSLEGQELDSFEAHDAYIYSLAALPDGDLITTSEDRTAKIWRGRECIQTITHPAISVWTVAVCPETGDFATGASDHAVRIFSRSADRQADDATLRAFDESVESSALPAQTIGTGDKINTEKLPGPEFLQQKAGTKEGQNQLIKESDGSVAAYSWSGAAQQWVKVGTVVDAGSSGAKVSHQGRDYDYVFDVDIEDGKPPLKLAYNLNQNPYEAAQKFITDNELPITYLDQVANFITTNTRGATLGSSEQHTQAPGSDPWGTGNRYRPGEAGGAEPRRETQAKILPQTAFPTILTADPAKIMAKIRSLSSEHSPLSDKQLAQLETLTSDLQGSLARDSASFSPRADQIAAVLHIACEWEPALRLPGLDLLRLCAVAQSFVSQTSSGSGTIIDTLSQSGVFDPKTDRPNDAMMAIRALGNMFSSEAGRTVMDGCLEQVLGLVRPFAGSDRANVTVAVANVALNYAVLITSSAPAGEASLRERRAAGVLDLAWSVVEKSAAAASKDFAETAYRGLVAVGTLLTLGEGFRLEVKAARNVEDLLKTVEGAFEGVPGQKARFVRVAAEIRDELK